MPVWIHGARPSLISAARRFAAYKPSVATQPVAVSHQRTMKLLFAFLLVLVLSGVACAQAQQKCFVNGGLKNEDRVYLTINGAQVAGEFIIERGYEPANRETYVFSGTKTGNRLNVKFSAGKTPDALPRSVDSFVWDLVTTPDKESLRIKFYGRNYNINRNEVYTADFASCEPSYAALAKGARRVSFANGANSASVAVALKGKQERSTFLLNLGKGQAASVQAIGCGISFYYPNRTQYEEGTAIDSWSSKALAQSGDYLFVISPAGLQEFCNVTFTAN